MLLAPIPTPALPLKGRESCRSEVGATKHSEAFPFTSPPLQGEGLSAVALAKEGQGGDGDRR
jgi:hypothetical protein